MEKIGLRVDSGEVARERVLIALAKNLMVCASSHPGGSFRHFEDDFLKLIPEITVYHR